MSIAPKLGLQIQCVDYILTIWDKLLKSFGKHFYKNIYWGYWTEINVNERFLASYLGQLVLVSWLHCHFQLL